MTDPFLFEELNTAPAPRRATGGVRTSATIPQVDPIAAARSLMAACLWGRAAERRKLVTQDVPTLVRELRALARWGGTVHHDPARLAVLADAIGSCGHDAAPDARAGLRGAPHIAGVQGGAGGDGCGNGGGHMTAPAIPQSDRDAVRESPGAHLLALQVGYKDGRPQVLPSAAVLDLMITIRRAVGVLG